ncbi:hypothetical protein NDU88_007728 [Pleurodeles waltl]|uniref:Uncharacterized protein n=1 Tax=Pleurodeles waltl TaxID=8319 RepID=A0AAV7QSQ2_PLEWA|nr:hypothetical protein NDU88_007728 [Pleurodeles waltl]
MDYMDCVLSGGPAKPVESGVHSARHFSQCFPRIFLPELFEFATVRCRSIGNPSWGCDCNIVILSFSPNVAESRGGPGGELGEKNRASAGLILLT